MGIWCWKCSLYLFISSMRRCHCYLLGILYVIAVVLLLPKEWPSLCCYFSFQWLVPGPALFSTADVGFVYPCPYFSFLYLLCVLNQREEPGLSSRPSQGSEPGSPHLDGPKQEISSLSLLFHQCWSDCLGWEISLHGSSLQLFCAG